MYFVAEVSIALADVQYFGHNAQYYASITSKPTLSIVCCYDTTVHSGSQMKGITNANRNN